MPMIKLFAPVAIAALALAACKPKVEPAEAPQSEASEATQPPTESEAPPNPFPKNASPERIAEIQTIGRTGLWSDVTEVCRGQRPRAVLTWNVADSGAERVILYVLDKDGSERNFGQGGAVGEKQTGPWLSPGTTFRLRDKAEKAELASLVIGEKSC